MPDEQSQRIRERRKHRRRRAQSAVLNRELQASTTSLATPTTAEFLWLSRALQLIKNPNRRLAVAGLFSALGLLSYLLQFL